MFIQLSEMKTSYMVKIRETQNAYYDAVKELSNPIKHNFSQVYEEVNIELLNRLQNRVCPHNEETVIERVQLYSFVGTRKKYSMEMRVLPIIQNIKETWKCMQM